MEIASAFVTIRPETSSFESELSAALGSVDTVDVEVGAVVDEAQGEIDSLDGGEVDVEVGANADAAQAEIDGVDGGSTEIEVSADTGAAQASIDDLAGSIGGLADAAGAGGGAAGALTGELAGLTGVSGGTAAGIAAVVGGLGLAVSSAAEAEGVQARLNAVLESTGAGAYTTAEDINELAGRVMEYSGQSDESVATSAALLATFSNLSTEAAQTSGVFEDAVVTTADIAALMGGEASDAALKLGRALDNPASGMLALQRSGVSFTEGQKATIVSLQESGDMLGAQAALLEVVESQVGGVAEAYGASLPGQIDRATESFGEMAESVGGELAPAMADAAAATADYLTMVTSAKDAVSDFAGGALGEVQDLLIDGFVNMIPGVGLIRSFGESVGYLNQEATGAATSVSLSADAAEALGVKADAATGQVVGLTQSLDEYITTVFGLTVTRDEVEDSFDRLFDSLVKNGPAIEGMSEAARANRDALQEIVSVTGQWIEVARDRGATEEQVAAIQALGISRLNETRDAFGLNTDAVGVYSQAIRNLPNGHKLTTEQPGMALSQDQVLRYHDRIYTLPRDWNTRFIADTGSAQASIQALIDKIAQLNRSVAGIPSGSTGGGLGAKIGAITAGLQQSAPAPVGGDELTRAPTPTILSERHYHFDRVYGVDDLAGAVLDADRRLALAEGYEP